MMPLSGGGAFIAPAHVLVVMCDRAEPRAGTVIECQVGQRRSALAPGDEAFLGRIETRIVSPDFDRAGVRAGQRRWRGLLAAIGVARAVEFHRGLAAGHGSLGAS